MQMENKGRSTGPQKSSKPAENYRGRAPGGALPGKRQSPRILFLTRTLTGGGAERQLAVLALGLHRVGWEVAIACFYNTHGNLQGDLEQAGVRVIDLKKRGRWDVAVFIWRLLRVLREYKADIVHGYMHVANILALLARFTRKRSYVVWGVRSSDMDWARYNWLMRPAFWLSCKLARYADCIIANSRAGADYHVKRGYPQARTVVIPNGIDTDYFRFDPDGRNRLRAEWGISQNEVLVGVVARLDPMKDHATFLKAAAIVAEHNSRWRFACVGEGSASYMEGLRAQASKLGLGGLLVFTGARNDMVAVYSALDVVCSSSSWGEGFPNVIAEAMACERPCVVTDVGDSARVVGDCGVMVSPRNPQMLSEALEGYWAHEHQVTDGSRIGTRARARVSRLFSVDDLVASTAGVLRALYSGGRGVLLGAPFEKGNS